MKRKVITVDVMAPLVVGDPHSLDSESSQKEWDKFARHLKAVVEKARKRGATVAVSFDIWWGLVEIKDGVFDWRYYDKLIKTVTDAEAKLKPIFSFHRCGGNVGDTFTQHLPRYIWKKIQYLAGVDSIRDIQFVSEQDNSSDEFISVWATQYALPYFERFMQEFQNRYSEHADEIIELNVSLGPAGELRYPSYNNHDEDVDYPTRGALQCYSELAVRSLASWAMAKYKTVEALDKAWGTDIAGGQEIRPPSDPAQFFSRKDHVNTQYGRDLFDWYSVSLLNHGRRMILAAYKVFSAVDAPFRGIDIGIKVPGIHWRTGQWKAKKLVVGDRLAELAAGLIRTSDPDRNDGSKGFGYRHLMNLLAQVNRYAQLSDSIYQTCFGPVQHLTPSSRIVLHFTCLEMPDGEGGKKANSIAKSLVTWVGQEAQRQEVPIKGENAVWWNLPKREAWELMRSHLAVEGSEGAYEGITILRIANVVDDPVAFSEFEKTLDYVAGDDELSDTAA